MMVECLAVKRGESKQTFSANGSQINTVKGYETIHFKSSTRP